MFTNPHTYPEEDIHFRRVLTFDKAAVAIGIAGALLGQGKGRWLVVLSGLECFTSPQICNGDFGNLAG